MSREERARSAKGAEAVPDAVGRASSLQNRIRREIERHKRGELGRMGWPYLNNFHCRLPGGLYRTLDPDFLDAPSLSPEASPRLRTMTLRQFYALIDRLIAELGLDVGRILAFQAAESREIYDYTFPLYVRLRAEGFKHYPDLTS
ncbi:MAG: hypothetical protein KGM24_00400 [Elusimicrobia bacterium]|nr:hypothetical protein [Elusimicrobiota bacterium]